MRKSLKKATAALVASVFALSLAVGIVPNVASAAVSKTAQKAAKAEYDPAGTYHAYFGMQQQESWIFRDPWYAEELGLEGVNLPEGVSFDSILQSKEGVVSALDGTVIDAEITGNGVYTVGVEGLNGCLDTSPDSVLAMIYVDTDVPATAKDTFQISNVKLQLDGVEQTLPETVFFNEEEHKTAGLLRFDPVNAYQKEKGNYPDSPSVVTPSDSIKIVFTVSGMAQDNPDAVEATPTPAPKADDADSDDGKDGGISGGLVAGIVVVVVVVVGAVVVVSKKKKN